MLLNFLWFGLILLAFVSDLLTGMPFSSGMDGLSGARAGLELALTLAGPVCLWSGLSQAMERARVFPIAPSKRLPLSCPDKGSLRMYVQPFSPLFAR